MSISEDVGPSKGLVERVKGILLTPGAEWDVIDAEPATTKGVFTGYVLPLAAIPPAATLIGSQVFGYGAFGVHFRPSLVSSLSTAVVSYVLAIAGVFILALIIEALAPTFNGVKDRLKAVKVAAYSYTAAWVAGVFQILPALTILALLGGLYSLFLLYKGLPKLMKAPEQKAIAYVAVTVVVAIVVSLVIAAVSAALVGAVGLGARSSIAGGGAITIGDTQLNVSQMEESARKLEKAAKDMQAAAEGTAADAAAQAVPAEQLKSMLPAALGGLARTEVSANAGGIGGLQGSNAEGIYQVGDARVTLSVTDLAVAGGLAGLAGAINVSSNRETATGYEKVGKVNGRMTTDKYDRQGKSGEYSVLVANRFMVQAQGSGVSAEQLKAAVDAVGLDRLESLAKG